MNKFGAVLIIIAMVSLCYLLMLFYMPIINTLVESANTTMTTSGANLTAMPGAQSGLISTPWIIWWLPGVMGMAIVVVILKRPSK